MADSKAAANKRPGFVPALKECYQLIDTLVLLEIMIGEAEMLENDVNVLAEQHGKSHYEQEPLDSDEVYRRFREAAEEDRQRAVLGANTVSHQADQQPALSPAEGGAA